MVAFLKLANVLGLCLLAVKASSASIQQGVELSHTSSSLGTANEAAIVDRGTHQNTVTNSLKARQSFLAITTYVCVTLGAAVNFNSFTGIPTANGRAVTSLAQGTCLCVYIDVDPLNIFNPLQTAVYLSDGTQLQGSAAATLATSIFSSQCGLLGGYSGCGSFSNTLGVVSANQANAGVCLYAKAPLLSPINIGFSTQVGANTQLSGLRPSAGANVGLALQGYSQCCALQCATNQFVCGGVCVSNTNTCVSGRPVPKTRRGLKRGADQCPAGKTACPVPGTRSWDCVDTDSDVETCGGCVNPLRPNARNSGVDCTAITGAGDVACVRGKCQIRSCAPRFALSADGNSCERLSSLRKNKDVLKKARRS